MKLAQAKLKRKALEEAAAKNPSSYSASEAYFSALAADGEASGSGGACEPLELLVNAITAFGFRCPLRDGDLCLLRSAIDRVEKSAARKKTSDTAALSYDDLLWERALPRCTAEAFIARSRSSHRLLFCAEDEASHSLLDAKQQRAQDYFHSMTEKLNSVPLLLALAPAEAQTALRSFRAELDESHLAVSDDSHITQMYEQLMRRSFNMALAVVSLSTDEEGRSEGAEPLLDAYRLWEVDEKHVAEFSKRHAAAMEMLAVRRASSSADDTSSSLSGIAERAAVMFARLSLELPRQPPSSCEHHHQLRATSLVAKAASNSDEAKLLTPLAVIDQLRGVCIGRRYFAMALMLQLRLLTELYFADVTVQAAAAGGGTCAHDKKGVDDANLETRWFHFPHCSRSAFMHFCSLLRKYVTFGFAGDDAPPFRWIADVLTCAVRLFYAHSLFESPVDKTKISEKALFRVFVVSHGSSILYEVQKVYTAKKIRSAQLRDALVSSQRVLREVLIARMLQSETPVPRSTTSRSSLDLAQVVIGAERMICASEAALIMCALETSNNNHSVAKGSEREPEHLGHVLADLGDQLLRLCSVWAEVGESTEDSARGEAVEASARLLLAMAPVLRYVPASTTVRRSIDTWHRALRSRIASLQVSDGRRVLAAWRTVQLVGIAQGHGAVVDLTELDFEELNLRKVLPLVKSDEATEAALEAPQPRATSPLRKVARTET